MTFKLPKKQENAFVITVPIIFNKKNKQASISIPKRKLSPNLRKELNKSKTMKFTIRGFNE